MNISLKKFSQLPDEVKNSLSSPEFLGQIEGLEKKHDTKLTMVFIELVVGNLALEQLNSYLTEQRGVSHDGARDIGRSFSQLLSDLRAQFPKVFRDAEGVRPLFPAGKRGQTPGMDFSLEDKEEIEQLKNSLPDDVKKSDYNKLADEILGEFGYQSDDEVLHKRIHGAIMLRLKDVRDDLETRHVLEKNKKVGGLELSADEIDRLLALIKNRSSQAKAKKPGVVNGSKIDFPVKKPFVKSGQRLYDKIKEVKTRKAKKEIPSVGEEIQKGDKRPKPKTIFGKRPKIKEEDGLPVIEIEDDLMVKPEILEGKETGKQENRETTSATAKNQQSIKPAPQPIAREQTTLPRAFKRQGHRPKLDDVKFVKSLVGPVEELGNMTLIDFRRLSAEPQGAIRKIRDKIDLLERDSYTKRVDGIKAWHQSEVSNFYRMLGQKSIADQRTIEDIIGERLEASKPTLSISEFNAIMELNKQLRY